MLGLRPAYLPCRPGVRPHPGAGAAPVHPVRRFPAGRVVRDQSAGVLTHNTCPPPSCAADIDLQRLVAAPKALLKRSWLGSIQCTDVAAVLPCTGWWCTGPSFNLGRFHPSVCLQMLAWMQNPVPASRVSLSLKCEAPTDISPDVGSVCATYVG